MLRDKAYDAEDVLDELDYFRLQDAIYGTSEAADKGCCRNLVLNTRHTAKAVVGKLLCSSATTTPGQEANAGAGCMRKLVSGACNTVRHSVNAPLAPLCRLFVMAMRCMKLQISWSLIGWISLREWG
jgi:hypothetical protein